MSRFWVFFFCCTALTLFAEETEIFPAAPWNRAVQKTVVATTDEAFPRTVLFGCREPLPFKLTFAGTVDSPQPRQRANVTLSLNYTVGCGTGWGYKAALDLSKTGRHETTMTVFPDRPVDNAYVYYYYPKSGVTIEPLKFEFYEPSGDAILDGIPVMRPKMFETPAFLVRDAAAMGGYSVIDTDRPAKGLKMEVTCERRHGARFLKGRLSDTSGKDRAVTLLFAVPLPEGAIEWWDDARRSRVAEPQFRHEFSYTLGGEAGKGQFSRYPIGAVTVGGRGIAIGIDPQVPACYRIALNPKLRLLFIAYDLGLAVPERNYADVALTVFGFKGDEGFRGAFEKYRSFYPESFVSRVKKHGVWTAFHSIREIADKHPEDFHFRFNEYMWDPDFDDAHDILSLRYMEPCTWWMKLTGAGGKLPTYDECMAKAKEELAKGLADAKAWETSVFKDEFGYPAGMILDKPWCKGIAWSMNASPGVKGEMTEYKLKQSEKDFEKNYGSNEFPKGRDGEYIDSSELACTVAMDFDRQHFAGMRSPLTFSTDKFLPCAFKGLIVWDYSQDISRRLRERNRVLFANATPNKWSYLTPLMDAVGIEIGWMDSGSWKPSPEDDLLYWRTLAGDKPYCFLMTNSDNFTREATEKFMKICLAYGLIPGFQPNYYFKSDRADRDRELHKRYLPFICKVSEAGWRPVNRLASTRTPGIRVEQFGDRMITVFNHGAGLAQPEIRLLRDDNDIRVSEALSRRELEVRDGLITFPLGSGEVALLEFE